MWRLGRLCTRRFSVTRTSYISDSEQVLQETLERLPLPKALTGVVVRRLPSSLPDGVLENTLGKWLGVEAKQVRTFYSISGKPAYCVVSLPSPEAVKSALSRNKSVFATSKVYISSIPEFLQANSPLTGGYDPRRVIVSQLDPFWQESHLIEMLKPVGEIMGLYMPRDYDFPFAMQGIEANVAKELPEEYMNFRKMDIEEEAVKSGETVRPDKFLTRAYDYFNTEAQAIEKTFAKTLTESELEQTVGEIADLWGFVRGVKDEIVHKPDEEEGKLDDVVNELMQKPEQSKALEVFLRVSTHGRNFLNAYFQNRGYAYVTFSTRHHAERAIACSSILHSENNPVSISFHRNEPGYFFNSGKISEAIMDAILTHADKGRQYEMEKEASMLARAVMPMEVMVKKMRAEKEMLGGKDMDPVVEGTETSYEAALDTQSAIAELNYSRPPAKPDLMSSDEEYFDDVEEDRGRVDATTAHKAAAKALKTINPHLNPAVSSLPRPDSSSSKPTEVSHFVSEVQRFFSEAVPSVYKSHPHLLQRQRYGDHPQVRYVCTQPFDYSVTPAPKSFNNSQEKRKFIRSQIRNFVLALKLDGQKEQEMEKEISLVKEKPEEEEILKNPEKYVQFTDSDEEKSFKSALTTDPQLLKMQQEADMEGSNAEEMHMLLSETALSASKKIHYTGDDLEAYLAELRGQYPQILFTTEKTEQNEVYIIATHVKKHLFDIKHVQYIAEKYEKQFLDGVTELEIDPKDRHVFEKLGELKDVDLSEVAVDMAEQLSNQTISAHIAAAFPTIEEMKELKELSLPEFIEEFRRRKAQNSAS